VDTVVLDQHSEPWVATFTGLGSVHVHADGNVDVTVAGAGSPHLRGDPVESSMMREQALRWGWGEPLALVRRGFRLLRGTTLVSPDRPGCLIVPGQPNHTEVAVRSATLATDLNAINGWEEGLDLP
jgi:hypothetical protein